MGETDKTRIRRLACLLGIVIVIGIAVFVLRGPHISNALKRLILPEIQMASGRKVIARRIYINLFPLFAEARGIKVFDEDGNRLVAVPRAKAYIDLSGLLSRRIVIRRLVIKEPEVGVERKQAEQIIENVKAYLARERETPVKVKIRVIEIQKGNFDLRDDAGKASSLVRGLSGEISIGDTERIRATAEKVVVKKEGWPNIAADVDVNLLVKENALQIKRLVVGSFGSRVSASGDYGAGKGSFATKIDLLFSTVKRIFSLERSGNGEVSARGLVTYADRKISLDLKLDGNFYIQTLMELLKVKDKIEGLVDAKGEVKGPIDNLRAKGSLAVRNGNFYDVAVDSVKCNVSYADGEMKFTDGAGKLYNGRAKVAVSIRLPVVNYYTVDVDFEDIDSPPVFKLIGWSPGVEPGKVRGTLKTAGADFSPAGRFEYRSVQTGKDILGRIKDISGNFNLQGQLLSLSDLTVNTDRTAIRAGGTVDIGKKVLDLDGHLKSADITDVSQPYYGKLRGAGEFDGKITGSFDDPVIGGNIRISGPVFENYAADLIEGDVTYRKEMMGISRLDVRGKTESFTLNGGIYFRGARELFDLAGAEYHLKASLANADMGKLVKIFYPEFRGSGRLRTELGITGRAANPSIAGDVAVQDAAAYDIPFDSASFRLTYKDKRLGLSNMKIAKGKSVLTADASLDDRDVFSFKATSEKILLSDIVRREIKGNAIFSLKAEGGGTIDNPSVSLSARVIEGVLKGRNVGSGSVTASIKQKDITVRASMINDGIQFQGKGRFEKDMPWEGRLDVKTGRYDSLLSAFLKDVPEDLILSVNGTALLRGDRNHISASAQINQIMLSMYGYSFSNDKEIRMDLKDRNLVFNKISMRSGDALLNIDGSLTVGKQYNLELEGRSSLSPFKSLSNRIAVLRGDADFVLSVSGDWNNPQINGGVTLANGAVGLKDLPYRLSGLGGYLYMDNDRVVLQKMSGKMGGGDVDLSGVVYLKKFSLKRFYVEAKLDNITSSLSNDFNVNFGGDLLLKGTPSAQQVSGDIRINRARYRERVEWKSWLLKTRKTERFKGEISDVEKAELNIRVTGKDNIQVDNNIARAAVSLDMVLKGTIYHPVLLGRLETGEGTVYFRNNDFRILHASADFSDPNRINPFIMISADTLVKGYKITMNLEGQLDHFNMSLASDPVLKDTDILSLLTVGQTGTEMKGLEGSIGASEATGFVTGKLQDVLEERLKTITGVDRFQIDPHVSRITGTVEPQVTVSKRIMGDRMYVSYATAVGSKDEQIIKLEYLLSKNMSLVGVRDERGIIGGDVMFRFSFK